MYLVAECMTMSAPNSSGRVRTGVAKVLSTASSMPPAWARLGAGGDVGDRQQRIAGAFDPQQFSAWRDGPLERGQIGRLGERNVDARVVDHFVKQPIRSAINIAAGQNVVALGQQHGDGVDGGHARGERQAHRSPTRDWPA